MQVELRGRSLASRSLDPAGLHKEPGRRLERTSR
jgi:hypothetical protein